MLIEIIYYIFTGVKRWCKQRRPRGQLSTIKIFSFEITQKKIKILYKTVKQFGSFKRQRYFFFFSVPRFTHIIAPHVLTKSQKTA